MLSFAVSKNQKSVEGHGERNKKKGKGDEEAKEADIEKKIKVFF